MVRGSFGWQLVYDLDQVLEQAGLSFVLQPLGVGEWYFHNGAFMDERFSDNLREERVTQEEAEKVIELWARLQQEKDAQNSMPTVGELAEVLGASETDVRQLLSHVRTREMISETQVQEVQVQQRPRRFLWIGVSVAAVGVAMVFLLNWIGSTAVADEAIVSVSEAPVAQSSVEAVPVPDSEMVPPEPIYDVAPETVDVASGSTR